MPYSGLILFYDNARLSFLKKWVLIFCFTQSRLGMSVTTQGGSGRQYVTGSRRNLSKYRFVLLNVYRFRET